MQLSHEAAALAVIGAMIESELARQDALASLEEYDWPLDSHQRIFRCLRAMTTAGIRVDHITLRDELQKRREIDAVGGFDYLIQLGIDVPRNPVIAGWIRILKDRSLARKGVNACRAATQQLMTNERPAAEVLDALSKELVQSRPDDSRRLGEILPDALAALEPGSNPCTVAQPCQTIAHANALLAAASPGDMFLFNGGDQFRDDFVRCGTAYQNTGTANTATNPPQCRNVTIGSYGSGRAIIDAADAVCAGKWTVVQTGTYQCVLPSGSSVPEKLYVDPTYTVFHASAQGGPTAGDSMLQQQLLPVPNYIGGNCTGSPNYLDAYGPIYNSGGEEEILVNLHPNIHSCNQLSASGPVDSTTFVQGFNRTTAASSGLQNVEKGATAFVPQVIGFGYPTYPGVWNVSGNCPTQTCTIYLNLADGTNPNSHVIEATHRPYDVLIQGTNNVTVRDVILAHAQQSCMLVQPYSLTDSVANNITAENLDAFNCAGNEQDPIAQSSGPNGNSQNGGTGNNLNGDIVFQPSAGLTPLLLRHPKVLNSRAGTVDTYFSSAGGGSTGGIFVQAGDGGGPANDCVICGNVVATTNTLGALYSTGRVSLKFGTIEQNNGGRMSANICTQTQGCFNFTGVKGGLVDHNFAYEAYGEPYQMGGSSTSVDGGTGGPVPGSQVWLGNRAANMGLDATGQLYNGFDCNTNSTAFSGYYVIGNAIYNVYAAGETFEQATLGSVQNPKVGCLNPHVWNNVFDNNAILFGNGNGRSTSWKTQADSLPNQSQIYYINPNLPPSTYDFRHNWYLQSSGVTDVGSYGRTCAVMLKDFNDTTDACYGADPQFVNPLPGFDNLTLKPTSPLIGAGLPGFSGGNIGLYFTNPVGGFFSGAVSGATQ